VGEPKGPFTRWWQSDGGWLFEDFATLKEAIEHQPYTSGPVVVTKPVVWEATEKAAFPAEAIANEAVRMFEEKKGLIHVRWLR